MELAWNYDVLVDIYRIAKGFINLFATLKNDAVSDGKIWGGGEQKKSKFRRYLMLHSQVSLPERNTLM